MAVYAFDEFELDLPRFELRRAGTPLNIEPQVLRILLLLVENRDRLVTRDEMLDVVWKGRIVSEAALSSRIKSVRQALGDNGSTQRYVRTVRGEGFRFVGTLSAEPAPAPVPHSAHEIAADVARVMARPLIGVFPFACEDPDARYFADGLAETLIAELAAARWFPVLSRHAAFAVPRGAPDLVERARALGARYAVIGRVASHRSQARLTIDLIDIDSDQLLFSEIFEGDLGELLGAQRETASAVLHRIAPELEGAEHRRIVRVPAGNLSAWDLTLKALWALNLPSPANLVRALDELENSIRLDPGLALPWSLKAQAHFEIGLNGWLCGNIGAARGSFEDMLESAQRALALDPRGWMGHALASAGELFAKAAYLPARFHADQALRLNPSAGMAHHLSGCIVGFGGDPAEAIAIQECVYQVDPAYRHATVIEADLGLWHFVLGDLERAARHLDTALAHNPGNLRALQRRIAVLARLGDIAAAREDVAALAGLGHRLAPDQLRASYPFQDSAHADLLIDALTLPGVLE